MFFKSKQKMIFGAEVFEVQQGAFLQNKEGKVFRVEGFLGSKVMAFETSPKEDADVSHPVQEVFEVTLVEKSLEFSHFVSFPIRCWYLLSIPLQKNSNKKVLPFFSFLQPLEGFVLNLQFHFANSPQDINSKRASFRYAQAQAFFNFLVQIFF